MATRNMLNLIENKIPLNNQPTSDFPNLLTYQQLTTQLQQTRQPMCSVSSPPLTMLQHSPIIPLLSQLFASARLSHSVQIPVPKTTLSRTEEMIKHERKLSVPNSTTTTNLNPRKYSNPFLIQSTSNCSTSQQKMTTIDFLRPIVTECARNFDGTFIHFCYINLDISETLAMPAEANNYMQINLVEAAARLAFGSIMILEMERKVSD
jgi:hypothetical protein